MESTLRILVPVLALTSIGLIFKHLVEASRVKIRVESKNKQKRRR